jgi:hypothetical protein
MSCGSFRTGTSDTTVARHVYGTEQLHHVVRRDLVRWQSLKV